MTGGEDLRGAWNTKYDISDGTLGTYSDIAGTGFDECRLVSEPSINGRPTVMYGMRLTADICMDAQARNLTAHV